MGVARVSADAATERERTTNLMKDIVKKLWGFFNRKIDKERKDYLGPFIQQCLLRIVCRKYLCIHKRKLCFTSGWVGAIRVTCMRLVIHVRPLRMDHPLVYRIIIS